MHGLVNDLIKQRKERGIARMSKQLIEAESTVASPGRVLLLSLWRGKARPPEVDDDVTAVGDADEFL